MVLYDRKAKIKICVYAALVLLVTLFIFSNSIKGPEQSGKDSGRVTKAVVDIIESVSGEVSEEQQVKIHYSVRKLAHFLEFAALAITVFLFVGAFPFANFFKYSAHALLYGLLIAVFDEFIQSFTKRGSAVKDVLIDFSGFITGTLLMFAIFALIKFIKEKRPASHAEQA